MGSLMHSAENIRLKELLATLSIGDVRFFPKVSYTRCYHHAAKLGMKVRLKSAILAGVHGLKIKRVE